MKTFYYLLLTLFLFQCKDTGDDTVTPVEEETPVSIQLFDGISDYAEPGYGLQAVVSHEEFQFATFGGKSIGQGLGAMRELYFFDKEEGTESVMLLDENAAPAFVYQVNTTTMQKEPVVTEFEPLDDGGFYVRLYHYDWENRIGTLLAESKVHSTGNAYTSDLTFQIKDENLGNLRPGTKGRNRSFRRPLRRLERLQLNRSSRKVNDGIVDFISSFDQFRKHEIVDFLGKTENIGLFLGLSGAVLASSPLIVGGAGLYWVSKVTKYVISDQWLEIENNITNEWDNITSTASQIGQSILSRISNIGESAGAFFENAQNSSSSLGDFLSEFYSKIDLTGEDLNDLPDSNGVLQFGLSWDTDLTDIDIWVTDPAGETISYLNPTSGSGGYLDRDDVDGYGPENVYWESNIPNGQYRVYVHYYGCDGSCPATNYTLKISNGLGDVLKYSGTLSNQDDREEVARIRVSDGVIQ